MLPGPTKGHETTGLSPSQSAVPKCQACASSPAAVENVTSGPIAGTVGSTAGNYAWYWVGATWGKHRLEGFIDRRGRWLTLEWEDIEKARSFFQKHGPWVVFLLRFTPFLRTMISLPAGIAHMGRVRFLVYTTLGVAIWNLLLIEGGRRLSIWLAESQHILGYVILGFLALGVAGYLWRLATWKPRAQR